MSLNDGNKDGSSKPTAEYPGLELNINRAKNTFYRRRERPTRGRAQDVTRMNAVDNNGTGNSSPRERSADSHTRRDSTHTHEVSDTGHRDSHREHTRAPSPRPSTRPLSPSPLRDGSSVHSKAAEGQSKATRSDVSHRGRQMDIANDGGDFSPPRLLSPGRFVETPVSLPRKGSIPALDDGVERGSGRKFPLVPEPAVPSGTSVDSRPSVSSPLRKATPTSLITGKPVSADITDKSHQRDLPNKGTAGQTKTRSVQSAPPPLPKRREPASSAAPASTPTRHTRRFYEEFDYKSEDSMSSNVPTSASGAEKKKKRPIWERIGFEHAKDEETESRRQDRMKPHRAFKKSKYLETRKPSDRYETMLGSSDI